MQRIQEIVDIALAKMAEAKVQMMFPGPIPEAMQDPTIEPSNDWRGWKPIPSVLTDQDLTVVETKIGHALPESYKSFLKHKHFYELSIEDKDVNFPSHLPDKELNFLLELVFNAIVPDRIIGKGYIYFADFQDYGLLCFDTNMSAENNDYPVVYIDIDDLNTAHRYADNFLDLLEGDSQRGNRFVEYLNGMV
ncbi:SMI1/KNR4 family protein [Gilvibacter sp.]|uniref:SMI1/KNR4 family protein n=1 Tax=Gilvibacter sp. TaxID=2729997 RepID=UPI003F49D5BF